MSVGDCKNTRKEWAKYMPHSEVTNNTIIIITDIIISTFPGSCVFCQVSHISGDYSQLTAVLWPNKYHYPWQTSFWTHQPAIKHIYHSLIQLTLHYFKDSTLHVLRLHLPYLNRKRLNLLIKKRLFSKMLNQNVKVTEIMKRKSYFCMTNNEVQ